MGKPNASSGPVKNIDYYRGFVENYIFLVFVK